MWAPLDGGDNSMFQYFLVEGENDGNTAQKRANRGPVGK